MSSVRSLKNEDELGVNYGSFASNAGNITN